MNASRVSGVTKPITLDTMCPMHYALADRLDVLGDLLQGHKCYSTTIVRNELLEKSKTRDSRIVNALSLPWLDYDPMDTIDDLSSFAIWTTRLGADPFHLGEASVFAVAEKVNGLAITDDAEAKRVAVRNGLTVHGNLWLLAQTYLAGKLTLAGAGTIVDLLQSTGLRLPCRGSDFESWARTNGLI